MMSSVCFHRVVRLRRIAGSFGMVFARGQPAQLLRLNDVAVHKLQGFQSRVNLNSPCALHISSDISIPKMLCNMGQHIVVGILRRPL